MTTRLNQRTPTKKAPSVSKPVSAVTSQYTPSVNQMGVNAKTPNPIQSRVNALSPKQTATSTNLVNLSKNMSVQPPKPTIADSMRKDWGIVGKTPFVVRNLGQNVLQAGVDVSKKLIGDKKVPEGPGYTSLWSGIYGPSKAETEYSKAQGAIADASIASRQSTTPKTVTNQTTAPQTATTATPSVQEQLSNIQQGAQDAQSKVNQLAKTEQEDTQAKREAKFQEKQAKSQQEKQQKQQDTYWKQILDQIKATATDTETPKIVQKSMDRVTDLQQQIADLETDYGKRVAGLNVQGMDLSAKSGEGAQIQQNYQAKLNALSNQLNQANTQLQQEVSIYGTQSGLLQGLAGQTAPQMQFGQLTDPTTGTPMSGGSYGSNPQLQTAVQQAYQIYQSNGGNIYDPRIQQLTSTFGMPAEVLLNQYAQAGSGGQMPNFGAQASSVETRNSLIQQLGPQAVALDSALQSISKLEPIMTDFMAKSGISPTDNSTLNQLAQEYRGAWGDQATTQFNTMLGELQKFSAAVLGSGTDLTPSAQSHLAELQNPGNLSLPRIQQYLSEIHNLGQSNLNVQLGQIQNLGGTGYFGNQGTQATESTWQPNQSTGNTAIGGNIQNPYAQAGMGVLPYLAGGAGALWATAKGFFK